MAQNNYDYALKILVIGDKYVGKTSLIHRFSKGNFYYFNNFCYKNQCPNGKISLSSTNESKKTKFQNFTLQHFLHQS